MPPVSLVTVPLPLPVGYTKSCCWPDVLNTALIVRAASILTVQVGLVAMHAPMLPVQVTKLEPGAGAAVRVTKELMRMSLLQSVPQLMTVAPSVTCLPVTVPAPVPNNLVIVKVFAGLK